MSLDAANPAINATVSASAGSGRTWLLITRIVRLLLAGAEPGNILSLTFTRKAAGEMQIRLNQRLYEMATASDESLNSLLAMAGCATDAQTRETARGLYEKLLHNLYPVRLQTFHSFCQDILAKFPLEADIPPGFELLEDTGLLEQQAWQALFVEATQTVDSVLAKHLETLMDHCNGVANTRTSLDSFIAHRSDWWAFTHQQNDSVLFAVDQLRQTLQLPDATMADLSKSTLKHFFEQITQETLQVFANLLREHPTATNLKHADITDAALTETISAQHRFESLKPAFLTQSGSALKRKDSKTLQTKLGSVNAEKFLDLHGTISEAMIETTDKLLSIETLQLNQAWYYTGSKLLSIFQRLKREQRQLDFTDLEWKCFQLINHADNAQWIQYKIDQRIDHILIDEFQDTNPTQWHLLAPLLEEIAATDIDERQRSVFLVGDEKQSIYSFRRANPKLQAQASDWLASNLNAQATPLDASRRSSQAIIDCVNRVFLQDEVMAIMPGYSEHKTWLTQLPGQVCLTELFQTTQIEDDVTDENTPPVFRNPLEQPHIDDSVNIHTDEARHIARQIQQLISERSLITDEGIVRPVQYGDIMILMRNRVHIETYEEVLRQQSIPFIGSKRGGLLDNVEIQDLIKLLDTLITPFNNLALAQVLKSPLFAASDEDLLVLAQYPKRQTENEPNDSPNYWYQRLQQIQNESDCSEALKRAAQLLPHWRELANTLPIHDCLDRIFVEANLLQRYAASSSENNKQRVMANCQRLLELSLENDSGRYPGVNHFLQHLKNSQQYSKSPLDEPLVKNQQSRVTLMTIHGSKGLEAPIVFLADCNTSPANKFAYSTYVHWPEDSIRPLNFMLQSGKVKTDSQTAELQQQKANEAQREDLNLLYVALTRAREQLFISGIASKKKQTGWYQLIHQAFSDFAISRDGDNDKTSWIHQHLNYTDATEIDNEIVVSTDIDRTAPDPRLCKPLPATRKQQILLAPSKLERDAYIESSDTAEDSNARLRGMVIHRAIEMLCKIHDKTSSRVTAAGEETSPGSDIKPQTQQHIRTQLAADFLYPVKNHFIEQCFSEALSVFSSPSLSEIFQPDINSICYNELPVLYSTEEQAVYGLIDRVIKTSNTVYIIDYKSHRVSKENNLTAFAEQFRPQLNYYQQGLVNIWPHLACKTGIVFTHSAQLVWL